MLGLAKAQFGLGQPQQTRQTLDALIAANPSFRSHDGHLLYARAVEGSGDTDAALHEYDTLAQGYPGEEARVRYAQLLQRIARNDQARAVYEQVLRHAAASPKHYQREQRAWSTWRARACANWTPAPESSQQGARAAVGHMH